MNKKKLWCFNIFVFLVFVVGAGILFYPTVSNMWNQYRNSRLITNYSTSVSKMDDDKINDVLAEAQEYNQNHTVNSIVDAFNQEDDYVLSHPYDSLLNPNGDEVMGYLDIPKIHISLAIYHGVGPEALENGCGHVEGTSLPIGGESTHSVIAAHRGLPSAKLFTDLDQLEVGDLFYISVMNNKMAYQVDQIKTVLPNQVEDLAIVKGEELVTLLTCTPYAVNSHRLLVRGHRTTLPIEEENLIISEDTNYYFEMQLLAIGLLVCIILILLIRVLVNRKK